MGDKPTVFLTESRRQVLNGEYEGKDNTKRTHKSRIRARSSTALDELIEVAESPEIDTEKVFKAEKIFRLLQAVLQPDYDYSDGLQGGVVDQSQYYTDDYEAYANRVYVQMNKLLMGYHEQGDDDETESEQTES